MTLLRAVGRLVACSAWYWVFMSPYSQAFGRYAYRGDRRDRASGVHFDNGPNEPYTSQRSDMSVRVVGGAPLER
jgi:hypothetical protein